MLLHLIFFLETSLWFSPTHVNPFTKRSTGSWFSILSSAWASSVAWSDYVEAYYFFEAWLLLILGFIWYFSLWFLVRNDSVWSLSNMMLGMIWEPRCDNDEYAHTWGRKVCEITEILLPYSVQAEIFGLESWTAIHLRRPSAIIVCRFFVTNVLVFFVIIMSSKHACRFWILLCSQNKSLIYLYFAPIFSALLPQTL